MSKELIVSSTAHETKVAILEDDELVELYFEREKQYGLAGSIYKGRVTRVLPGMQSAFVNIGLDRDAFLYVSDFFEDNEEYDRLVTTAEEKVLKMEEKSEIAPAALTGGAEAQAGNGNVAAPAAEPGNEAAPEPGPPPRPVEGERRWSPAPQRPFQRGPQGGPEGERRGRRGRRRGRMMGGRGFPESKYASRMGPPPQRSQPLVGLPVDEDEDIAVLPGESLAKYTQAGADEARRGERAAALVADAAEPVAVTPRSEERLDEQTDPVVTAEAPGTGDPPEPVVAEEGSGAAATAVAEPGPSAAEDPEPVAPAPAADAVTEDAPAPAEGLDESVPDPEEALPGAVAGEEPAPAEGSAEKPALPEAVAAEPQPRELDAGAEREASVRERPYGKRYLHRGGRRMRQRGARPDFRNRAPQAPAAEAPAAAEPASLRPGETSISDLLKEGQEIIVQIAKEPLGKKGARITSHIALPGRYLVYMPTVDHVGVSRKIVSDEERLRLKRIVQTHRVGMPGGFIVRTAGEGQTEEEVRSDMHFLYNLWLDMRQKAERKPAPLLIHHDLNLVERLLRDQLTETFKTIWVDSQDDYERILQFVERFQPGLVGRVKLYTRANPIFDEFGITPELEKALRPKVWLKSGGYIVINQTEALVAVDVNTGKYVGKSNRLEDTIVKTYVDAVKEIVRQIRLRDLGGIIVVDFIDMDERKNRQKVMQALDEALRHDRSPSKILQFNDFGLVAITRKRVKQSLERTLCSPCPYCDASGYVKSVTTMIQEILVEAKKIARTLDGRDVTLRVNPDVAKALKSRDNTYLEEIEGILHRPVLVKGDSQLHQERFDFN
jgi:ribonuclease G